MLAEVRYIKKFGLFGNKMRYMNKFINLTFWFNPIFYLVMVCLVQRLFAMGLFNAISMTKNSCLQLFYSCGTSCSIAISQL